jgi:hypothetical protein
MLRCPIYGMCKLLKLPPAFSECQNIKELLFYRAPFLQGSMTLLVFFPMLMLSCCILQEDSASKIYLFLLYIYIHWF